MTKTVKDVTLKQFTDKTKTYEKISDNGNKFSFTIFDSNGNGFIDPNDSISFTGDPAGIKPYLLFEEVKKCSGYVADAAGKSDLPEITTKTTDNVTIFKAESGKQYNLGSFVKALNSPTTTTTTTTPTVTSSANKNFFTNGFSQPINDGKRWEPLIHSNSNAYLASGYMYYLGAFNTYLGCALTDIFSNAPKLTNSSSTNSTTSTNNGTQTTTNGADQKFEIIPNPDGTNTGDNSDNDGKNSSVILGNTGGGAPTNNTKVSITRMLEWNDKDIKDSNAFEAEMDLGKEIITDKDKNTKINDETIESYKNKINSLIDAYYAAVKGNKSQAEIENILVTIADHKYELDQKQPERQVQESTDKVKVDTHLIPAANEDDNEGIINKIEGLDVIEAKKAINTAWTEYSKLSKEGTKSKIQKAELGFKLTYLNNILTQLRENGDTTRAQNLKTIIQDLNSYLEDQKHKDNYTYFTKRQNSGEYLPNEAKEFIKSYKNVESSKAQYQEYLNGVAVKEHKLYELKKEKENCKNKMTSLNKKDARDKCEYHDLEQKIKDLDKEIDAINKDLRMEDELINSYCTYNSKVITKLNDGTLKLLSNGNVSGSAH